MVLFYFSAWQALKLFQKWSDFGNLPDFLNFSGFQNFYDFQNFRFLEISNFQKLPDFQNYLVFQISFGGLQFCLISLSLQFYLRPRNNLAATGSL